MSLPEPYLVLCQDECGCPALVLGQPATIDRLMLALKLLLVFSQ